METCLPWLTFLQTLDLLGLGGGAQGSPAPSWHMYIVYRGEGSAGRSVCCLPES